MARRNNFFSSILNTLIREHARNKRERLRLEREIEKDQKKQELIKNRQNEKRQSQFKKEAKENYINARISEVKDKNRELSEYLYKIRNFLMVSLKLDHSIKFNHLLKGDYFDSNQLPKKLLKTLKSPEIENYTGHIEKPTFLERFFIPGAKRSYNDSIVQVKEDFDKAMQHYQRQIVNRNLAINEFIQKFEVDNQIKIEYYKKLKKEYFAGEREAIIRYCEKVLESSEYMDEIPHKFRITFRPLPKELVIEYQLPHFSIIPEVQKFVYVKTRDAISKKLRKPGERKEIYQEMISGICLRTLFEIFQADKRNYIDVIVFNGFVEAIDPATGNDIKPHLLSVRASKNKFMSFRLNRVDKRKCLQQLGATISPQPEELLPVQPIIDFDMADIRFVDHTNMLSELDKRPNLMDLNPFEFEELVTNLFEAMGLKAKLTRSSNDGGVDVVAFDNRPILGGKLVIQAKRYKHRVEATAIRDLFGTMQHEGAAKGILITTSHYGSGAYDWASNKPIELIDGNNLLYLLKEYTGYKARIIMPPKKSS